MAIMEEHVNLASLNRADRDQPAFDINDVAHAEAQDSSAAAMPAIVLVVTMAPPVAIDIRAAIHVDEPEAMPGKSSSAGLEMKPPLMVVDGNQDASKLGFAVHVIGSGRL